jgi:hypothetical protein
MTGVADLLSRVRIGDIYTALTAAEPRHSGANRWRARATWRGGDGWSVQLDDSRGVWHDFVTDDRGGVLDLIRRVRGGSRYDALRWLAVYAGVPLDDRPLSQDERERWAEERRRVERDLPTARYWRDTVVRLAEDPGRAQGCAIRSDASVARGERDLPDRVRAIASAPHW